MNAHLDTTNSLDPCDRRRILLGFGVLVTISTVQLWLQAIAGGRDAELPTAVSIAWMNLVATLPWLPLAFGIFYLVGWRPPTSTAGVALHAAVSLAVSLVFLVWLSFFHVGIAGAGLRFADVWWPNVGEYLTVCLVVYWLAAFGATMTRRSAEASATDRRPAPAIEDVDRDREVRPAASPVVIRSHGRTRLVDPASIEWIAADAGYARLHTADGSFLLRRSLTDLARQLADAGFARIHRASIVRLELVVEVRPLDHGEARIVLHDGTELKVSRTYRGVLAALGI